MVNPRWLETGAPTPDGVQHWLLLIFPEGTNRRAWLTNANAARTVFVMLYSLAVEANDRWIAPKAVVNMSDAQANRNDLTSRIDYLDRILRPGALSEGSPWLAANSREGIRDEAIRALKEVGAVVERDLPKTSSKGRYALTIPFADLFAPARSPGERMALIDDWRLSHLGREELARLAIRAAQAFSTVKLPDGTTQPLSTGPSQAILKAIIEQFAPVFLVEPVVLSYSDSASPVKYVNEVLMNRLGLSYRSGDPLPDVLLADIASPLRFAFVEAVASEGPIDAKRVNVIQTWLTDQGFTATDVFYVTAYYDRGDSAYRRTIGHVAWGTFVWFATEPEHLLVATDRGMRRTLRGLADLVRVAES